MPAAADVRAALVGRDALLAQLDQRLERARAGQRQLVFLSGEAGSSATRSGVEPNLHALA